MNPIESLGVARAIIRSRFKKSSTFLFCAWEAFIEWFINVFISTIPIWVGAILMTTFKDPLKIASSNSIPEAIYKYIPYMVKDGELFAYAAAGIAPMIYIFWKSRSNKTTQNIFLVFAVICMFIGVISACFIGVGALELKGNTRIQYALSQFSFIVVFILLYTTLYMQNYFSPETRLLRSNATLNEQTEDFLTIYMNPQRGRE